MCDIMTVQYILRVIFYQLVSIWCDKEKIILLHVIIKILIILMCDILTVVMT